MIQQKPLKESLEEVVKAIILAVILVTLVVYLFWETGGINHCRLFPFLYPCLERLPYLQFADFSINTLTLFGFVLAVGTVVDDSIVVVENVQRHIENGVNPKEATLISMEEITGRLLQHHLF